MSEHLSEPELRGFVRHALSADRAIAAGDHLAVCESCRERAAAIGRPGIRLAEMSTDLLALEAHVSEEEIQRYVEGELPSLERARLERHVAECEVCGREIDDLRKWTLTRSRKRTWLYLAAAAAIAVIALIPLAIGRWHEEPALPGLELLSLDQQAGVKAALSEGVAGLPALVAEWTTRTETLMGERPAETAFTLTAPLATVTVSDRPVFRWDALPGADEYTIAVLDEDLQPVVGPVALAGTTWIPPRPLARNRTYVWQVTARRGSESVTAPAPPAPSARFRVMDERSAALLDRVSRAEPGSHLLLGILYTKMGARQEAEEHLRQVPSTDPYATVATRTLERLRDPVIVR